MPGPVPSKPMACLEPPDQLVRDIEAGLMGDDATLGLSAMVSVAEGRRNTNGWPEVMVAALVLTPEEPAGVPAVWACATDGGPIFAVDGAAREYSTWSSAARGDSRAGEIKNMFAGYPETLAARQCVTTAH